MAPFTDDESSWSRLDYVLLRDGGVALYWADHVLREDLAWLRGQGYAICELDAGDWKAEEDFHDAVAKALEFPGYDGRNLDAFKDCMADVGVPLEGGMAIVIRNVDDLGLREGKFFPVVLDILAATTRTNLLFGRRLVTLLHSRNPAIEFPAVGAVPVLWNPREWTNAKRGL
jgi:RNAse (barnase) inhibitor barstar